MRNRLLLAAAAAAMVASQAHAIDFVNAITVAGNGTDKSAYGADFAGNRLGGFGSDLVYDKATNLYYGLTDRGPGGGTIDYAPRIQAFKLGTDGTTGAIGNFKLVDTIVFSQGGAAFSGLNPAADGRPSSDLGRSFDPEGLAISKNGTFLVSDEYGPSVYEFSLTGSLIRKFKTPQNLVPKAGTTENYVDGRPVITAGRQDNRGFEGLTISADGTKAYAILQDPLVNEGAQNDGRRSRNVRLVEFDMATGEASKQVIYRLENIDDINGRIPGTANDFTATNQGRSIGVSSIMALPNGQLLVIERDNRGFGVDDPNALNPIGSKRIYLVDISQASDVSTVDLAGANGLPAGIKAASKTLFLDINAALKAAGIPVAEKLEGFSFGRWLADGSLQLTIISDNDYSVTQNGSNVQFNVCTSGPGGSSGGIQIPLDGTCPDGTSLIPSYLYSFKLSAAEAATLGLARPVPEPATWAMMIAGFGLVGGALRRRKPAALAI